MDELKKIRLQVINPATGEVIENVDAKTATGAVYLPDGTTLTNWMNNVELYAANTESKVNHMATLMQYVDPTSLQIDQISGTLSFNYGTFSEITTGSGGYAHTQRVDTGLSGAIKDITFVDGTGVSGYTADDALIKITTFGNHDKYIDVSSLIDIYDVTENATEVQLTIDDDKVISASLVDGGISRKKIDAAFEKTIADLEANVGTGTSVDDRIATAIEALDAEITTAEESIVNVAITEVDGKLTAVTATIDDETFDAYGAAKDVQGETTETVASVDAKVEALTESSKVTVEKLTNATEGYISSYVVKQNGVQVGTTIDIPKDYLVKSAELKTAGADVDGVVEGHKYIDFVVNSVNGDGNESHIHLDVNTLVDVYGVTEGAEQVQLALDPTTNKFSATIVDGGISYEKLDAALKAKVDAEYELPTADADTLGGVKVANGTGIAIDGTGIIYADNIHYSGDAVSLNLGVEEPEKVIQALTYVTSSNLSTDEAIAKYLSDGDVVVVGADGTLPELAATTGPDKKASEFEYNWFVVSPTFVRTGGRTAVQVNPDYTRIDGGTNNSILDLASYVLYGDLGIVEGTPADKSFMLTFRCHVSTEGANPVMTSDIRVLIRKGDVIRRAE